MPLSGPVLIVGGGPAGCVAAITLARAGVRVQLLERAQFPRDKLCGDTVNPGTMAMLQRLDAAFAAAVRARALPVTGMVVTGPGGATVAADYPSGVSGVAITRRDLDGLLLGVAADAGVDVLTGTHVRSAEVHEGQVTGVRATTSASTVVGFHAPLVIAADGRRSSVAFELGLSRLAPAPRRWAFGAYFSGVDGLSSRGEMHIRDDGYIGVAPLPGGIANVCVVREQRFFRLKAEATSDAAFGSSVASGSSRKLIHDIIGNDPLLRARFVRATQISGVAVLGPLAVDAAAAGCPGLLLAGDAAGFVDPMTGDGLRFAVRGGQLAAAAALRELETGTPAFGRLARWRHDEFAGKWRINRALRMLVGSPATLSTVARISEYWASPVRHLIGIAGDVSLARA